MKYYFILNPASGSKSHKNDALYEIRDAARKYDLDYDVYFTKAAGDARSFVRQICQNNEASPQPQQLRFIGWGGDGTLHELVNGAFGYDHTEIGIIPYGTGNDYVRNYGDPGDFMSLESQILGQSRPSDLIRYETEYDGAVTEGLCVNMFNIGFDCNVVDMTDRVKALPLMGGSAAYLASIFITLAAKRETDLKIEYGDGSVRNGKVLLASVANGCFCGGGIKGVPRASLRDGLMDVSVVKSGVTRRFFVRLFPKYQKGIHLSDPEIKRVIDYRQQKTLTITANDESLRLCVDGEISTQKRVTFSVIQDAFRFIVPAL
ncbi:MAG: diacylglycerol kinase family protein [Bacillota bacterium]|nr:diacylglycerol kinase family protein [Bacillota bacterium]